jgi:hypothetical protein
MGLECLIFRYHGSSPRSELGNGDVDTGILERSWEQKLNTKTYRDLLHRKISEMAEDATPTSSRAFGISEFLFFLGLMLKLGYISFHLAYLVQSSSFGDWPFRPDLPVFSGTQSSMGKSSRIESDHQSIILYHSPLSFLLFFSLTQICGNQ